MVNNEKWERFKQYYYHNSELGLGLDISRMRFPHNFLAGMEARMRAAYREMAALEAGALANPDENRMVGHYWLRAPHLSPTDKIAREIEESIEAVKQFARYVHQGKIRPQDGRVYKNFILIGIGGSALGPQLLADALRTGNDALIPFFIDNTDPDGIDRVLGEIADSLDETLVLVISKSGGTVETHNGMLEVKNRYSRQGLIFADHAVAVTVAGSKLDQLARREGWLARFPLWDWVGGRTSVTSAVGLLPAALQGVDIDSFLEGARACDAVTRQETDTLKNPAALLALMWYYAGGGEGRRDMVILPYKDNLQYLARYLQQLVMESLGKAVDRNGRPVRQGLTVYGNKGSTDQHAYVQQLLDGVDNSFIIFVEVLADRRTYDFYLNGQTKTGDYLRAFLLGTRQAQSERGRESLTITIREVSAFTLGVLIALFERAVGFYASLVNVNAYHQPGVELVKKGANMAIDMLANILQYLDVKRGSACKVEEVAAAIGYAHEAETVFKLLEYLCAEGSRGVKKEEGAGQFEAGYYL